MIYPTINGLSKELLLEHEVWRDIPTHKNLYQVSNFGRIKRLSQSRIMRNQVTFWEQTFSELVLKAHPDSKGYPQVSLTNPKRVARVHRLVAEAFLNPPSEELLEECRKVGSDVAFVNHKDEDSNNPNILNLEWCTPAYNNKYSIYSRNNPSGSESYQAILDEDKVRDIVEMLRDKVYSQDEIADMYGVKQITISNIWTGRSWNQVTGFPVKKRSVKAKIKSKQLFESALPLEAI